jgi:predicted metal-dependent hydrolase
MAGERSPKVEVRRSRRRRRTVSAYRDGDTVIVLMPAHIPAKDEAAWVDEMVARLDRTDRRRRPSDEALARRAQVLMRKYLPRDVSPASVRWVTNQNSRWGSCTPVDRTIRLSHRLQQMPQYVIDYVLLHELAHLIEGDHGPAFHQLMAAYPQAERARGFLEGWSSGTQTSPQDLDGSDEAPGVEPTRAAPTPAAPKKAASTSASGLLQLFDDDFVSS